MEKEIKTYLVGGAVRDSVIGRPSSDNDYVVVGSTPEDMVRAGFKSVGIDFPVYLHPETKEEYALARKERSVGDSYNDFIVITSNVSLRDDLGRRDLTMNAMAMPLESTKVIDPFNGEKDIEKKVLRHVSDAFKEDPVRVLRLARFRAELCGATDSEKWTIAHETKVLVHSMRPALATLTKERVWKEVEKVLNVKNNFESPLAVFLETLYELRVLDVIFPELHEMVHCREGSKHHRESNVFVHTMMMLRTDPRYSPRVQLGILFHDIAKPSTYITRGSSSGHDNAAVVATLIPEWVPVSMRRQLVFLIANHTNVYKTAEMKPGRLATFIASYKRDSALLRDQLLIANADDQGRECDPGIRKVIQSTQIIEAHLDISQYSPTDFIESYKRGEPSGDAIKQHIHNYNISVVKKCFKE